MNGKGQLRSVASISSDSLPNVVNNQPQYDEEGQVQYTAPDKGRSVSQENADLVSKDAIPTRSASILNASTLQPKLRTEQSLPARKPSSLSAAADPKVANDPPRRTVFPVDGASHHTQLEPSVTDLLEQLDLEPVRHQKLCAVKSTQPQPAFKKSAAGSGIRQPHQLQEAHATSRVPAKRTENAGAGHSVGKQTGVSAKPAHDASELIKGTREFVRKLSEQPGKGAAMTSSLRPAPAVNPRGSPDKAPTKSALITSTRVAPTAAQPRSVFAKSVARARSGVNNSTHLPSSSTASLHTQQRQRARSAPGRSTGEVRIISIINIPFLCILFAVGLSSSGWRATSGRAYRHADYP